MDWRRHLIDSDEPLRDVIRTYEPVHTGVDVAVVLPVHLLPIEAIALLTERRRVVKERRALVAAELCLAATSGPLATITVDHRLCLMDAEIAWLGRSLAYLRALG